MQRRLLMQLAAICCAVLSACLADADRPRAGEDEPFRVRNAQFFKGALPGRRPSNDEEHKPLVTALETANLTVRQGQGGKVFSGRASADASSVALALDGVGSGYWVVPTNLLDVVTGDLTWSASTEVDFSILPKRYVLRAVAIDEAGRAGDQTTQNLCVLGRVPDNGRACSEDKEPPRAVISLQWDADADLDLQVVAPGDNVFDPKHVTGTVADSGEGALLDRDSNAGCSVDGMRTENLVWNEVPPSGVYRVYVNLSDACGEPAVRFSVSVYAAEPTEDGTASRLVRYVRRTGQLLALSADPRAARGLYIVDATFE